MLEVVPAMVQTLVKRIWSGSGPKSGSDTKPFDQKYQIRSPTV